ncbi:unnamed protein product, partial [Vitis vinifera]
MTSFSLINSLNSDSDFNLLSDSFSWENSLPFNENDSQEMLLLGMLASSTQETSETGLDQAWHKENVVVLEDLGTEYLEQLLTFSETSSP